MNTQHEIEKNNVAIAALEYVPKNKIIGIGTGSTVNYFIHNLANIKNEIKGTVSSLKLHRSC